MFGTVGKNQLRLFRYQSDAVSSFKCEINLWLCRLCHVKNWAPVQRIYAILKQRQLLREEQGQEVSYLFTF